MRENARVRRRSGSILRTLGRRFAAIAAILLALAAPPFLSAQRSQPLQENDAREVIEAVCPRFKSSTPLGHDMPLGCGACPSFTAFSGTAPAKGGGPAFELRQIVRGAFTRPGADEALAEFFGCEPHVYNFGGTVLLKRSGSQLRRVRYFHGTVGMVRAYRMKNGRDLVLSQGGYTGQGISTGWVSTYLFSSTRDPLSHTLIRVEDNSGNACQLERVKIAFIPKLEFTDLNGDGIPDLQVMVRSGGAKVPERFQGKCDEVFKPPEVPAYTIGFLFDGTGFRVSPESAALLRRLSAKSE